MKKMTLVLFAILFTFTGYSEGTDGMEADAKELLLVLSALPDNSAATSPRQNELMKRAAARTLIQSYFHRYKNTRVAVRVLTEELSALGKTLPMHSLVPLAEQLRIYKIR